LPAPLAPVAPAPARIPFKITPPASDLCPPPPMSLRPAAAPVTFSETGPRVRLGLRKVLESVPPFQLTKPIESVPEDAMIELPFSILQPQLALGRVAISPAQFVAAMPEEHRAIYHLDDGGLPVALPLPEILQNLPNESLQLRPDQEEPVVSQLFETPFSQKAAEDAARLHTPAGPITKKDAAVSEPKPEPVAEAKVAPVPKPSPVSEPAAAKPDGKSIIAELSQLAGVKGCAVVFSDGLSLAGNLPAEYEADALCAMAPELVKRIHQHMSGANFGALRHLTLFCEKAPVSFFAHENICLAVLHASAEISAETQARLHQATLDLARHYTQPAPAAADHA
jgi:predicted regulator of Ras-like GTPase activity (Roadblock/LC7/MglB family)